MYFKYYCLLCFILLVNSYTINLPPLKWRIAEIANQYSMCQCAPNNTTFICKEACQYVENLTEPFIGESSMTLPQISKQVTFAAPDTSNNAIGTNPVFRVHANSYANYAGTFIWLNWINENGKLQNYSINYSNGLNNYNIPLDRFYGELSLTISIWGTSPLAPTWFFWNQSSLIIDKI